jgi:prolyl-tRNA editing enzyme YbaK/EbsC (Cys-tRNA(Pro) deacylase)
MSLPDATEAKTVTGYERGTITPFGSINPWPVVADERVVGRTVAIGGGAHGVSLRIAADDVIKTFAAQVADVTDTEPLREAH